jgi:hypothetical protein
MASRFLYNVSHCEVDPLNETTLVLMRNYRPLYIARRSLALSSLQFPVAVSMAGKS